MLVSKIIIIDLSYNLRLSLYGGKLVNSTVGNYVKIKKIKGNRLLWQLKKYNFDYKLLNYFYKSYVFSRKTRKTLHSWLRFIYLLIKLKI